MTQLLTPVMPVPVADPQPRRWTREEFHQMAEMGLFHGQRVELMEGEIVVLNPQGPDHYTATDLVTDILRARFGPGFHVRMQGPIELGTHSEPEPDIAVVIGSRDDYRRQHPTTAVLVVEVSDSTLSYDRNRKASLFARARLADYWIVNLVDRQLEVFRNPIVDHTQHYGFHYANRTVLALTETVTPLGLPGVAIRVADLFP